MATSMIQKPATKKDFGISEFVDILSVATDDTSIGFHIVFKTNTVFSMFYLDNNDHSGIIGHAAYSNASITELSGTLPAKSSDTTNVYLRVGNWARMTFLVSSVHKEDIEISTYTS